MIHFKVQLIVTSLCKQIIVQKYQRKIRKAQIFTIKEKNRDNHKRSKFSPKFINLGKTSKS